MSGPTNINLRTLAVTAFYSRKTKNRKYVLCVMRDDFKVISTVKFFTRITRRRQCYCQRFLFCLPLKVSGFRWSIERTVEWPNSHIIKIGMCVRTSVARSSIAECGPIIC